MPIQEVMWKPAVDELRSSADAPFSGPYDREGRFRRRDDAVSVIKSGEIIGRDPLGTVPHALIICFGSTVDALKAFDRLVEPEINRVALIDTFNDEKFECLNVAEALGDKLYGVRFDTPASRKEDFVAILEESRWELDLGVGHVKILVCGGLEEEDIPRLNRSGCLRGRDRHQQRPCG